MMKKIAGCLRAAPILVLLLTVLMSALAKSMDSSTPKTVELTIGADYVILKNAPPDELLPILTKIDLQSTNV